MHAPTTPGVKSRIIHKRANAEIARLARELAAEYRDSPILPPGRIGQFCARVKHLDANAAAEAARYGRGK